MVQALIIGLNLVKQLNFKSGVNVLSFPLYKTLSATYNLVAEGRNNISYQTNCQEVKF